MNIKIERTLNTISDIYLVYIKKRLKLNSVKEITAIFLFFIFFQKVALSQNLITQTTFSSTYNDVKIGQNNYSYRINFLLSNSAINSSNQIFPGILQPLESTEKPLFIPNGFSPNGDNVNDNWIVEEVKNLPLYSVNIYNKWGGVLYFEEYPNAIKWDGMFNGALVARSDYYYVFETGNKTYSGTVTVNY